MKVPGRGNNMNISKKFKMITLWHNTDFKNRRETSCAKCSFIVALILTYNIQVHKIHRSSEVYPKAANLCNAEKDSESTFI